MKKCPQTDSMSVYQHGQSVWEYTQKILSMQWDNMRIPEWFKENFSKIVNNLYPLEIIKKYNIYHDCGKPYCIVYDEQGRKHFPIHAQVSYHKYLEIFPEETKVANLIKDDMFLHTCTSEQLSKVDWGIQHAMTLLITAFAELHSNAEMFGGIESTSFKIKWKKLNKRGKQLVKMYLSEPQNHPYVYVITRKDLSKPQQAVQGSHGVIEATNKFQLAKLGHPSVIYLTVKNEAKLKEVIQHLITENINYSVFLEPDIDYKLTSVVTEPLVGDKRRVLRQYSLMR